MTRRLDEVFAKAWDLYMGQVENGIQKHLAWLWIAALCLAAGGCRTSSRGLVLSSSGPEWKTQEGQAVWCLGRGKTELSGDLIAARRPDGACVIQFAKTPLPILLAQTTGTNWLIEFPARHLCFTGSHRPPQRFIWLYLPAALSGQPLPPHLRFERKADEFWRLENTHSGESVEGFLNP